MLHSLITGVIKIDEKTCICSLIHLELIFEHTLCPENHARFFFVCFLSRNNFYLFLNFIIFFIFLKFIYSC